MEIAINFIVPLVRAGQRAYSRKWSFLAVFAFIFAGSVGTLGAFDLLPSSSVAANIPKEAMAGAAGSASAASAIVAPESPARIEIPAISLSASIANPTTTATETLDGLLLKGAVRYPTSAKLGENGNVVLFGHSSYLPIVGNQAYKTFNGIQKLAVGDAIIVYSTDAAYAYRVRSVTKESANDAGIPLSVSGRVLTLSTCDSFGAKTDRFVVVADFVESHSISP